MSDNKKIMKANPPWGRWEVLLSEEGYQVKRIIVLPGHRLSYQKHFLRSEHWVAVQGQGVVTMDGLEIILNPGQAVDIPIESAHRATNRGVVAFIFIEVQRGSYLGEDDIVRLEDNYGRAGAEGGVNK